MRSGPAYHVSSPPATASSSSRMGASVAMIPGAPWHALHADPAVAVDVECPPGEWRPVDEPILLDGETLERPRDAGYVAEGKHVAGESVSWTEITAASPGELLRPQALCVAPAAQPLDARRQVKPELAHRRESCRGCPTSARSVRLARSRRSALTSVRDLPAEGASRCSTSRIPVSAPEAALGVVVGKVQRNFERALEIENVITSEARRSRR